MISHALETPYKTTFKAWYKESLYSVEFIIEAYKLIRVTVLS